MTNEAMITELSRIIEDSNVGIQTFQTRLRYMRHELETLRERLKKEQPAQFVIPLQAQLDLIAEEQTKPIQVAMPERPPTKSKQKDVRRA